MTEYTITAQTQKLIDDVADYMVEQTYGHDIPGQWSARQLALAGLQFDLYDQLKMLGQLDHLDAIIRTELDVRARAAFEARRCQCPKIGEHGVCWHGSYPAPRSFTTQPRAVCPNYFEHDVPEIDGHKLCGTCYIATADERKLPME